MLKRLLAHPLTNGIDLDDPKTTALRKRIIESKPFLRRIYDDWYRWIAAQVPAGDGAVLELGSGAGHFDEFVPHVLTSEIFDVPGIRCVLDGQQMPFADASLKAIVMSDVLHHLPQVRKFFAEAARTLRPGGVVAMVEPWNSAWSRLTYNNLHHEPFLPDADTWEFPSSGPLSGANGALPWICFKRDRAVFEREFPQLAIELVKPIMPLRYLLSGGVSMRTLMPELATGPVSLVEKLWPGAMFARILLRRR